MAIPNSELEEITRVAFRRPMVLERVESLFAYVAKQTACRVDYRVEQYGTLDWGETHVQKGTLKICGSFAIAAPFAQASFTTYHSQDVTRIAGFNFETTPGQELEEINPSEVDLMKLIKSHVELFQ